jgi:O-acetyl-ADP-ribose deacetylase (regulator of RNase III)
VHVDGPAVEVRLKQKVTCKLSSGAVVMTDGGQLPCKSVIHVQYPPAHLTTTFDNFLSSEEIDALKCCIVNILAICKDPKYKFNSIAIPVIGSYSNKEKLVDFMWSMAKALRECVEVIKSLPVRHIVLVAYGTDNFKLFHDKLRLRFNILSETKFNIVDIDKCVRIKDCFVSLVTGDLLNMKVSH